MAIQLKNGEVFLLYQKQEAPMFIEYLMNWV